MSWRGHVTDLVECVATLQGSVLIKSVWYYIQYFLVLPWWSGVQTDHPDPTLFPSSSIPFCQHRHISEIATLITLLSYICTSDGSSVQSTDTNKMSEGILPDGPNLPFQDWCRAHSLNPSSFRLLRKFSSAFSTQLTNHLPLVTSKCHLLRSVPQAELILALSCAKSISLVQKIIQSRVCITPYSSLDHIYYC